MKKFLSLLLALTLVLSLVVVPARAADGITGTFSVTAKQSTTDVTAVKKDSTITFNAAATGTLKVNDTEAEVTGYSWTVNGVSISGDTSTLEYPATNTGKFSATCTFTLSYGDKQSTTTTATSPEVTVYDCEAAVTGVTFNNRTYTTKNSGKYTVYYGSNETVDEATWGVALSDNYGLATVSAPEKNPSYSDGTLTARIQYRSNPAETVNIPVQLRQLAAPTVRASKDACKTDEEITFTANSATSSDKTSYVWYVYTGNSLPANATATATTKTNTYKWTAPSTVSATTTYKVVCKIVDGSIESDRSAAPATVAVSQDTNTLSPKTQTIQATRGELVPLLFSFKDADKHDITISNGVAWEVTPASSGAEPITANTGAITANTLKISDNPTKTSYVVTAKFNYDGKDYTVTYNISLQTLSATLPTSVENSYPITLYTKSSDRHEDANLALVAQKVLHDNVSEDLRVTEATIKEARSTTTSVTGGTISKLNSSKGTYTFTADKGSLTPAKMTIVATAYKNFVPQGTYEIKLTIPVTPIMGTNFESVTAEPVSSTATTTNYRVYFPTTYTNYYVVNTSGSTPGSWSSSMVSGKGYNYNTPYPLSASNFNNANGTCTLYVIAKDGVNGNYYGGQMTVSLTNYDIKYSVVAGKDVTFSQKDFDSFVKEYAKNRGDWTTASRKDYPYVEFDHAELSTIPTAKTEGTLYYKGSEVTASSNRNAEYADLDRMTFEAASKPTRDTVTLRFSLVCKKYSSASDKGSTVTYPVNVVISIVKEDITYTVGIDDSVSVKVSDFVNFLQDAKTSYRKSTLDYVKFDVSGKNVSSYAYGGLYRSYSSYSTGKLADSTDKFYYEPSRTQYDLADVAYHTTRWAEAGKTVYIPFTVYGTKGEEASGTMAITIAQTMNFIDVKASDFFYEPVKWAVNNKITNGTSSTTFSPYKNCNRAEIVTFLWRAAGSPEPTVTRNPFTDVNSVRDASYYKAILWASQKGITAGTNATTFSPYQECTRSQIVTFLYRYAGKPSGYYSNPFKDVSSVNEASYYNAILWAVGKGITQGTSTTTFSPYASCTRGEAVTFLYRYVNGVK